MHLEYIVSFSSELLQEREREAVESMQEENGKLFFCPGLTKTILNQIFRDGSNGDSGSRKDHELFNFNSSESSGSKQSTWSPKSMGSTRFRDVWLDLQGQISDPRVSLAPLGSRRDHELFSLNYFWTFVYYLKVFANLTYVILMHLELSLDNFVSWLHHNYFQSHFPRW